MNFHFWKLTENLVFITVIAAMTVDCILDLKIIRGNVTGEIFLDFINTVLLQHLMTFNGYNPNSVIIMDNCSVHHVHGVVKSLHQVGTLVHHIPQTIICCSQRSNQ